MRGKLVRMGGERGEFGHAETRISSYFFLNSNRANPEEVNLFDVISIQKCIILL